MSNKINESEKNRFRLERLYCEKVFSTRSRNRTGTAAMATGF